MIAHSAIEELLSIIQNNGPKNKNNINANVCLLIFKLIVSNKCITEIIKAVKYKANQSLKPKKDITMPVITGKKLPIVITNTISNKLIKKRY